MPFDFNHFSAVSAQFYFNYMFLGILFMINIYLFIDEILILFNGNLGETNADLFILF